MQITGIIPSIIADRLSFTGDNIIVKGSDIDIHIKDGGNTTDLYAVKVGKDYEIVEFDDAAGVLSEYDEGDLISADVITKLFMSAITNSLILSFNPLGKIKYGIKDKVADTKNKFNKAKSKINKGIDWLMDNMDIPTAQEYIRKQKGFDSAKVGRVESMPGEDGGYFKIMVGNPKDKTYSVWQLYRNGNDIRTLNTDKGLDAESAIKKFDSLEGAHYDGSYDEAYENNNVNVEKPEENNTIEGQEIYDEDGLKEAKKEEPKKIKKNKKEKGVSVSDWKDAGDGFEYKISAAFKNHKKKKSKYNGCNVTGCENTDGTVALA